MRDPAPHPFGKTRWQRYWKWVSETAAVNRYWHPPVSWGWAALMAEKKKTTRKYSQTFPKKGRFQNKHSKMLIIQQKVEPECLDEQRKGR